MQHIQMLPLILVYPLHLDIEKRIRVNGYACPVSDDRGEPCLVAAFDPCPFLPEPGIIGKGLYLPDLVLKILDLPI